MGAGPVMDRVVLHAERLAQRAEQLDGLGANGIRLGYISLEPVAKPSFAWLDLEFLNDHGLAAPPPPEAFEVSGGLRPTPTPVRVLAVLADPGGNPRGLRLRLAPVGDYSSYTLSTRASGLPPPADALAELMDPLFNRLPFKFRPGCFNLSCAPPASGARPAADAPVVDTLARDYDSFRHLMMSAMAARVPGWAPSSEADLDQVLIDLIAARGDELADAHDRVMAERALGTARKRVSLARHARLVDYHLHQGQQASTTLAAQIGAALLDLPALPAPPGAARPVWAVYSGPAWQSPEAQIFAPLSTGPRWRRRFFAELNELRLYTWGDTVSALPKGATCADLSIGAATSKSSAERLRDLLLGQAAEQTGAPADVDASVDRLLLEEVLNPQTGTPNGRRLAQRQLLRLLPGPGRAQVLQDPVSQAWFCRVHLRPEDGLRENFCFIADCGPVSKTELSLFYGNLVEMGHGRPRLATLLPPGTPLAAADASSLLASQQAHWQPLSRPLGAGHVPAGTRALLPRDPSIEPLAYRACVPGGEQAPRSSLRVEVDGTRWDERIDLIASDGSEEHFQVETDELGQSQLRFGDGINGAPLPAGARVLCQYQSGEPLRGNVGADTLLSSSLPLGPGGRIWNPFDVVNGLAPESREQLLRRAPEAYRQRQRRAITLADYVAEAERLPGVSRANARYAWCGSWRVVQLVIDPVGGGQPGPALVAELHAALDALRLIGDDIELRPAALVPLDIRLVLCAQPGYWVEDLRAELLSEFSSGWTPDGRRGFFHPEAWTFGQDLHASQLIGRALAVQGIGRALRLSLRRFNHGGSGGALSTLELDPSLPLPPGAPAVLPIGPFEILVVANDPDMLERGRIAFELQGGRR